MKILINNLRAMEYNLEYDIKEFREEQKELFDVDGYRFTGVCMSDRQAEQMLRLINDLERALIKVDKSEQLEHDALLVGESEQLVCGKCGNKKTCSWCEPFNQPIPPEGIVL